MDLYLFNWTNPEELRSSVKPRFEEVGPYRVKEVKEKTNLTWNENNTISYMVKKLYYYDEGSSPRQLDDLVTTINPVPLTVAYQARNYNYFPKRFLSMTMSGISNLYVTRTARQILFDGYNDGILSVLSQFPGLNVKDKFGLFYGKNDTIDPAVYNMYTKTDEKFGKQLTWNYKNYTDFYTPPCNEIKGSATEFYPLNVNKTTLLFYSSELCKYAELQFVGEETIKGVQGYRFSGDHIFDNGDLYPKNRCFCRETCVPSGVLDVSKCRQNSPSYVSLPHFFAADPYYRELIDGMQPDRKKHEFYIVIEPKSGIIMDIGANMQLNMLLEPIRGFALYQDVPKVFIPMFYFAQHIELKDDLAANLRLIQRFPEFLTYASISFMALGIVVIVGTVCSMLKVCSSTEGSIKKITEKFYEEIPFQEKNTVT
ncbi:protein peste isoform X2 [Dendroctonus ponderosae]|nr:protein peste isoform X2 [Dendroctonus ponderosae]